MKALISSFALLCVLAAFTGCGNNSDTNNGIPTPTVPTDPNAGNPYVPPTDPGVDPRLPDLTAAVPLRLINPTDYSGLEAIAQVLFLPLVGDPLVKINFSGGRDTTVTGKVLVSFEDQEGFWAAEVPTFEDISVRTSNAMDMIFSDDEMVIRAVMSVNGDALNGGLFFRMRQSGETACKVIQTCYYYPYYYCTNQDPAVRNANCRNYMDLGNSNVRQLGTFQGSYSSWVVR